MKTYANAICISGTHGKTTTTSMVTHIFMDAGEDPTVMIGGRLPLLGAGHRVGNGETIIMESCEYCNSFLNFLPTIGVVLNVEADHLDFFKDLADVQASFRKFAQLVPSHGCVIANGDDENTMTALEGLEKITFGFGDTCNVQARNCSEDFRGFDVYCDNVFYAHIQLFVRGWHNILNALSAVAVSRHLQLDPKHVVTGLESFRGASRRMEKKGCYNGADIYDDYAHHPGELHALLESVKTIGYQRIICAFQPHTYTRTHALFDDFVRELTNVDIAVVAEIYAAREQNLIGISSADLVSQIPNAIFCATLPDVARQLQALAQPGDLILTVGAGDIFKAGEALLPHS